MKWRDRNRYETLSDVHFVTSSIVGFIKIFNDYEIANIIIDNLKFYQDRGDFVLLAFVIMPNHIHLVIQSRNNKSVSSIMANLKRITSRQISEFLNKTSQIKLLAILKGRAKQEKAECKIWKPRFDCMTIANEKMLTQKINYIHDNPVRAGLVKWPEEWKYSSAQEYAGIRSNIVSVDTEWRCFGYG